MNTMIIGIAGGTGSGLSLIHICGHCHLLGPAPGREGLPGPVGGGLSLIHI